MAAYLAVLQHGPAQVFPPRSDPRVRASPAGPVSTRTARHAASVQERAVDGSKLVEHLASRQSDARVDDRARRREAGKRVELPGDEKRRPFTRPCAHDERPHDARDGMFG